MSSINSCTTSTLSTVSESFASTTSWGVVPKPPTGQTWENLMELALQTVEKNTKINATKDSNISKQSFENFSSHDNTKKFSLQDRTENFPSHEPEIPIGALIVTKMGEIVATATNAAIQNNDPTAHAEILALRKAATIKKNYRLSDCIMVVTLEPCLMCVGAMVHARIAGVVYGARKPKTGAVESCINGFELPFLNHTVWHYGGILSNECADFLQKFFQTKR